MLRAFTDSTGVEWRVWEVLPNTVSDEAQAAVVLSSASLSNTAYASGWLCFESFDEKRRLAPIPAGWHQRGPRELEHLCGCAAVVPRRPRILRRAV